MLRQNTFFKLLFLVLCLACQNGEKETKDWQVQVRLPAEPDRLNPVLARSAYASQVQAHLFLSLLAIDPATLQLRPLLSEQLPTTRLNDEQQMVLSFDIHPNAQWDDGRPVLPKDFIFTLKALFNPQVPTAHYRAYLSFLANVTTDPQHPRRIHFSCHSPYILAEAAIGLLPVFDHHSYDPDSLLSGISIGDLLDSEREDKLVENEPELKRFADQFTKRMALEDFNARQHCGPYELEEWVANQSIRFRKKDNWWGDSLSEKYPALLANPKEILYRIVADHQSAMLLLKSEQLDVMTDVPMDDFVKGIDDGEATDSQSAFNFYNPVKLSYYQLAIQRANPILADKKVRRALAHLLDVDQAIALLLSGQAERVIGPIHPSKSYYHKDLPLIAYDLEKAKKLLDESGWRDEDGDGWRERLVDGEKRVLRLTYKVGSGNEIGIGVGQLLRENARKAGIEISLINKAFNTLLQEYRKGDFDLFYIAKGQLPLPDDLKQAWHRSSSGRGGSNRVGFGNMSTDAIIDSIQITLDPQTRDSLYIRIQELIYEDQACLFLFAPKERIAIHRRFQTRPSILRPGFFPQYFIRKGPK